MDIWQELANTAIAWIIVALVGAIAIAAWWGRLHFKRLPPPWPPLVRFRHVPWSGADIATLFVIELLAPMLIHGALEDSGFFDSVYGDSNNPAIRGRKVLWTETLWLLLFGSLLLFGLPLVRRVRAADLGLASRRALQNVTLGFVLWLVVTPLAYGIYAAMFQVTPTEFIKDHPLAETGKQDLWPVEWILLVGSAVFLAPFLEELIFRGLLLSWQLRSNWAVQATISAFAVAIAAFSGMNAETVDGNASLTTYNWMPVVFVLGLCPALFVLPSRRRPALPDRPGQEGGEPPPGVQSGPSASFPRPHLAIYTNALVFAALHSAAWPAPMPLFVLGLVLGWLKMRTGSLLGPIVVHVLFNAVAMGDLILPKLAP